MNSTNDLIADVQDEIGLDAYYLYPDSRRNIPDTVIWGFAAACVLEFVKGFVDFKQFGEKTKVLLLGLTRRIFKKQDFESFVTNEDLKVAVKLVVDAIPKSVDEEKRKKALQELEAALIELGMAESVAKAHADGVAELVCGKSTIG